MLPKDKFGRSKLGRSNTMAGTKKLTASSTNGMSGRRINKKGGESEINEESALQVDISKPAR